MKWNETKKTAGTMALVMLTAAMLAGCGNNNSEISDQLQETEVNISETQNTQAILSDSSESNNVSDVQETTSGANLEVCFGDDGVPFELHMENNETAQAIARYVGTSDWRLPVYDRDDSVDYSVMENITIFQADTKSRLSQKRLLRQKQEKYFILILTVLYCFTMMQKFRQNM